MYTEEKIEEKTPKAILTNSQEINEQNNNNIKMTTETENNPQNVTSITKAEKFEMINKIFLSNSSFNKHTKEYFITRFQIILILKNSNILNDDIITKTQADLILTKLKPNCNKFKFLDFMNYLSEICKYIFKNNYEKNPKKYLDKFYDYLLNNYYEYFQEQLESNYIETEVENNCTMNSLKQIVETDIEKHALKLLMTMYNQLKKIYLCYFQYEISKKYSKETIMLNSMENFIIFGKDFEIMPYLINEKNLVTYYNLLLKYQKDYTETINDEFLSIKLNDNNKPFQDIGTCFKLSTFFLFLYHFSILLYYKKFKVQFSMNNLEKPIDIEIILFFLQKLEHSKGISKYILRKQRTNEDKFTFIPSNENIEIALKELSEDKYEGKPILTSINDFNINITNSISPNNAISGMTTPMNNFLFNTNTSYENNIIFENNRLDKTLNLTNRENNNNNYIKGEEICKKSKNLNELINKKLIKALNSTSVNLDNSISLRSGKKSKLNTTRKEEEIILNNNNNITTNINNNDNTMKYQIYQPIFDFQNFLNVNNDVVNLITDKLENLHEVFLKYSKINDKLEFNRMSFSSFLKFLKDSNILIGIPKQMKEKFRKLGEGLMQKSVNVQEIKTYSKKFKGSVPCQNLVLTNAEKFYKWKISQIVNAKNADFEEQISIGEAAVIFNSLTNSKNFPIYTESIKLQFDKNSGINLNIGDNLSKSKIFDKKLFLENQQNVPGKMDFMLFIKSFELIAAKLYPDDTLNSAVTKLLENKIYHLLPKINIISNHKLDEVMNKLENEDIKYFLKELNPVMYPLFLQYTDANKKMKFSHFLEFYTQFDLFPELITLNQIKIIFFTLNETKQGNNNTYIISDTNNKNNTQVQIERLDYNKFLDALAITAMIFNYKNIVNDIDRLIYLCYQIYNAKPIKEDKLGGIVPSQANKNLGKFLKGFINRFKNKNKEEEKNDEKEKIKNKDYITNKEIKEQLDLQFDCDEEKKIQKICLYPKIQKLII